MIASRERGIVEQYISSNGSAHSAAYISFPLEDGTYDYLGFVASVPGPSDSAVTSTDNSGIELRCYLGPWWFNVTWITFGSTG